jgi:hypothetical protein
MMLKAIETKYKGYRFRSRLEARWAVFFDTLGFQWEYEPEGFDLNGVWYLPDFRVKTPQGNDIWYEIKPNGVLSDEKFSAFLSALGDLEKHDFDLENYIFRRAALLSGDPVDHFTRKTLTANGYVKENIMCPRCGFIDDPAYGYDLPGTFNDMYGCEPCDFETPSGGYHDPEIGILNGWVSPHKGMLLLEHGEYKKRIEPRVVDACEKARSARFEHGERNA